MIAHLAEAKALLAPVRTSGRTIRIAEHLRPLRDRA